jgi:ribonuclease VapC
VIVDTSSLMAITRREDGWEALTRALEQRPALIPAPVVVEFALVTSSPTNLPGPVAQRFLARVIASGVTVEPFAEADAALAVEAHRLYGRGSGSGAKLNMLDIMVYCMAKRLNRPILCTGRDFASTDASIHPASRPG